MYLAALLRNSSKLAVGSMHKLSKKGPGLKAPVVRWCNATSGHRSLILNAILSNRFMKARNDSLFSCLTLTKADEVSWRGRLVKNCNLNLEARVWKQSTEFGSKRINQLSASPLRELGNTRQKRASSDVYKPTWVTYISRCSSGSVDPSYNSKWGWFQLGGRADSITSLVKGWRGDKLLEVLWEVLRRDAWWLPES